ncbi:MAG: phosphatase PAP2 family protein [Acidobacteriota bacterium]
MRLLRPSEWLLALYFSYVALRGVTAGGPPEASSWWCGLTLAGWIMLLLLARAEHRSGSRFWSIVRDWLPAPLLLVAYWAVDWPPTVSHDYRLERAWLHLDKVLLNDWGGQAAIEYFGWTVPFCLDLCYSLLYAVPPVSIGILYLYRRRQRVDCFLFTLLLGVLTTYTLLPLFPSRSPRIAFPGEDLPTFTTPFRQLNLWVLDRCDIQASVFPSAHVTVGFSAALAMMLALPERKRVGWTIAIVALGVAVVTVYGRYHYAVDGLAAAAVSLLTGVASAVVHAALRRTRLGRGRS